MDLESAHRQTAAKMKEAIEKLKRGECRPYKPTLPMTVRVQMNTIEGAVKAAQLPGVLRIDDHSVEARVGRQCDVVKWLLGEGLDMPPKA
jgi:D-aminopeptidase